MQLITDLRPMHSGNSLAKFADDTYLVVPSANVGTRTLEIDNIATWAAANNLRLNVAKTREIVFRNLRRKTAATPPPSLPGISRENSLKILVVTCRRLIIFAKLSVAARSRCTRSVYCGITGWRRLACTPFSALLSCPG